jgi:hypothetical protein
LLVIIGLRRSVHPEHRGSRLAGKAGFVNAPESFAKAAELRYLPIHEA